MTSDLHRRIDTVEAMLRRLEGELAELRRLAGPAAAAAPAPPPPPRPSPPPPPAEPSIWPPPPDIATKRAPVEPRPAYWSREIDWGALFGARALAWAGGIVTVLGVVFFFVLAVNRGWIGPVERVGLGALASALVFAGGLWLHRRFGPVYSAYGAVGAGLAGGYATLVAAAALYGLVSDLGALAIAAAIGAIGLVTSLAWRSELIAGIGLVGATLIPMMVLLEEDLSPLGTGFAALVFAATATVSVVRRWPWLLGAGLLASLPQIAILVGEGLVGDTDRVVLGAVFAVLYAGAATAYHRAAGDEGLPSLSATLVVVSGVLAGGTASALYAGDDSGWAMLVAALAFAGLAALLFPRPTDRDLSALVGAVALALAAIGAAVLLSGPSLAVAWAAEAAVLAWLAQRIREPRYGIASLAYLTAAAIDALVEAPPRELYVAVPEPAAGALAPLAVAIGGAVVAFYSRPWGEAEPAAGFFAYLEPFVAAYRSADQVWRTGAAWLAGAAGVYSASLAVVGLAQRLDDAAVGLAFERGQVAVTGLWGVVAFGLVVAARRTGSLSLEVGGLSLAAVTLVHASTFDVVELGGDRRGVALLVAAATLLATAFVHESGRFSVPAAFFALATVGLAVGGALQLVEGAGTTVDPEGAALLAVAVFYAALGAIVFRRDRDFSTVLWSPALLVGLFAAGELVDGTWLVLALSATAAALAYVRDAVDEERLAIGSAVYLGLGVLYALGEMAPPVEFFTPNPDPAVGVPSLLIATAAGLVFARFAVRGRRSQLQAGAAMLSLYAASLTILALFQWIGPASIETDFQRGHSAVSAVWGVIGLLTLYVGLSRGMRSLRVAGFALFGVALAKLFLYDLANLSSVTRALSFLAVGAVLLLAGFFYQRLTAAETREAV